MPQDTRRKPPFFVFIIPAKNEERNVEGTIQKLSLLRNRGDDFKVILVDNMSTDRTAEIGRRLGIEVLSAGGNVGAVRNKGAERALSLFSNPDRELWFVFLDADIHVDPDLLMAAREQIALDFNACFAFQMLDAPKSFASRVWTSSSPSKVGSNPSVGGVGFFVSAENFFAVGGYDPAPTAGEDWSFCERLRRRGLDPKYISPILTTHTGSPENLWAILRQGFWYGAGTMTWKRGLLHHRGFQAMVLYAIGVLTTLIGAFMPRPTLAMLPGLLLLTIFSFLSLKVRDLNVLSGTERVALVAIFLLSFGARWVGAIYNIVVRPKSFPRWRS